MGIVYSSVVDTPRAEVFDWYGRPGAFARLSPPWQPLRIVSEADSLATGRAVLALPGGLRWVARHDGAAYDPPHRFVDELAADGLASIPVRATLSWRHIHDFTEVTAGSTRVIDRVETPVPEFLLRSTFAYRHRQLAGDLAAHRWASERGVRPAVVAVTGASGLVGSALTAFLSTGGHRVIRLVRRAPRTQDERRWDPADPAADLLAGVDAVVHLAGASIAGRFTAAHMRAIRDSRVGPTRLLAELAGRTDGGPRTFVSASAIGYYGFDRGEELLSEDSSRGDGFLADVVADWEAATGPAEEAGLRVVRVRTGVVQSARGGTLALLHPLFAAGLGGRIGDGSQWLSWIGLDDLVDVYHRALFDESLRGPVNAVAPAPVRNLDYTRTLARVLHRPAVLPVPSLGPRLLLGERGARELAEADQHVVPTRLALAGHGFRHPEVEAVLRHQLGKAIDSP
ncbi:TIGR01777 family oxidoreductase [Rhodococcus maanshanensis]|uniref:TIGR01777 family oxidoreductase n=1 Tax=Rhodococcus maanshanensis TaxID=183556 RepID=UPI0022B5C358|nr:TIGR01777 family oxidoreductase [Rhodococcus maanshanensis]MCZ4556197.1 TIGR01777 family oxidoreductase [Rhodococcus maanshanensis]